MFEKSLSYLNSPIKRTIDIIGSILGLLIGTPIFFIAAIITQVFDKVPFLFKQERIGLNGKPFTLYKLRTLKIIETRDTVQVSRMQNKPDYQTTATGHFWRVTSIDEIIQFWLVLKGDMSLIGHRPFPTYYLPHLHQLEGMDPKKIEHYLSVIYQYKPGMSSLSSVKGRGNLSMQEKFHYDLVYAEQASLRTDIKLLILTLYVVLTRQGAK